MCSKAMCVKRIYILKVVVKQEILIKTQENKTGSAISAIAERPRCRVRYSFGRKWKTGTERQYFTDITLSSTTVM